jgi:hypothetical protein
MRRILIALVLVLGLLVTATAAAQEPKPADSSAAAQAADLKKRGDELMVSLQYRDALDAYLRAYELSADPALLYNRARAHQALTEYPEALDLLERFAQTAPADLKARVPFLDDLLTDIRARVASVEVKANVPGARVFVRDKVEGTLPVTQPLRVRAGAAKIEVRADGYMPFVKQVELAGGKTTTIDARLVKEIGEGLAMVSINTSPPSALVSIDDRPLGTAPTDAVVGAGRHVVVVEADGYDASRFDVDLTNGQRRTMDVTLNRKASIVTRWWFWTGVGAVVVTGVVVLIAVTSTSEPPSGTIAPGQVRGPLTVAF